MPESDKSETLPSNDGSAVNDISKAEQKDDDDEEGSKRGGKRPRRSTQSVNYTYSDDDNDQNDDISIASGKRADPDNNDESAPVDASATVDEDKSDGKKTSKKRKRRKKAPKPEGNETFDCPHCKKAFKSQLGLQYHLDKFVCRTEDGTPKVKKKDQPPKKRVRKIADVEDRTCPDCKGIFKTIPGLKYHVGK